MGFMPELIVYIIVAAGMAAASYLLGHFAMLFGQNAEGQNADAKTVDAKTAGCQIVAGQTAGRQNTAGQSPFASAFRRLSLGALLIVVMYAVVICAGVTILAAVLPLLLFAVRFRMPRWRRITVGLAPVLLFCGVFVLLAALKFFGGHDLAGNLYNLHYDHSYYAALADYVAGSGIESTNVELMYPGLQSPSVYHWFDVHFTALVGSVTGNFFNARLFVALPLTAAAAVLGIAAVIEKYCPRAGCKTPWLACLVFLLPILLLSLKAAEYTFAALPFHDVVSEKIFVMICLAAWVILSKNKILPLVIGGLLVSSAAPALFGGAFIVLAARLWRGRRSGAYWKDVAALAFGGLWCVAFYVLTAKENPYFIHFMPIQKQIVGALNEFSLPLAKKTVEVFVLRTALNLAPCVLMFAMLGREDRRNFAAMVKENAALLLAVVVGIAFAGPVWFMRDAMQLATEVSVPVAFAGQTILIAMLLTDRRIAGKIATFVLIVAGAVIVWFYGDTFRGGLLDGDFTRKVAAADGPVVWVDTAERRETDNQYARDANYVVPFSVIRRLRNDYFPIRLDVYDIAYDPDDMRDYAVLASIENSTFYRWVESNNIPMKELRAAQTRFIKENGIHYVITPSGDMWINGRGFTIEERTELKSRGYTLYRISYDENPVQ